MSGYRGLGNPRRRFYFNMNSSLQWWWYYHQFRKSEKYLAKGEITPRYAVLSAQRVSLIKEKLPHLKIIYIIRNPIKRAWSGFRLSWFIRANNTECHLPTDAILNTIMHSSILVHGHYQHNINTWERYFGNDHILYLFYDDIINEPLNVLYRVFSFLNVPAIEYVLENVTKKINAAPYLEMTEPVRNALMDYFKSEITFIQKRFGRILEN